MRVLATVTRTFDSAHHLPGHKGKCAAVHGHTYELRVTVERYQLGQAVNEEGMVVDFGDIKKAVDEIIEPLDHGNLNDSFAQPTAENMAMRLVRRIDECIMGLGAKVVRLRLQETPGCYVEVVC